MGIANPTTRTAFADYEKEHVLGDTKTYCEDKHRKLAHSTNQSFK